MTSDRGLAGAVHSNINKNIRARLEEKLANGESLDNVRILCVGDKSRAFFQRFFPKQIIAVGSEIGRLPPTFNDAAKIANAILTRLDHHAHNLSLLCKHVSAQRL